MSHHTQSHVFAPSPAPRASRRAAIHPSVDRGRPQAPRRRRAPRERASIVVQQVDEHMLQSYVSYVLDVCYMCFIWML